MPTLSRLLGFCLFAVLLSGAAPLWGVDLASIEKTIGKQPTYRTKPRYCLLVFGAEARIRVWLVEDERVLYVDRNANGDLTDDGPPLQPKDVRSFPGSKAHWDYNYLLDEIKPVTGPAQTKFRLVRWNYGKEDDSYGLSVTLHEEKPSVERKDAGSSPEEPTAKDGGIPMYAGWFGTFWAESPEEASILHFGGPLKPGLLREKKFVVDSGVHRLSVGFTTSGLGKAGPTYLSEHAIPMSTPIHVRIEWPVAPGSVPLVTTHKLEKHCCYWEYYDPTFRVPQGKGIVEGTAQVTIELPGGEFPLPLVTNKLEARVLMTDPAAPPAKKSK